MTLDHSHVLELRQLLKGAGRTTQPKAKLIDDLLEAKLVDWHAGYAGDQKRVSEAGFFVTPAGELALALYDIPLGRCDHDLALQLYGLGSRQAQADALAKL